MRVPVALIAALIPTVVLAQAPGLPGLVDSREGAEACFARSYDAAHLARVPAQRTTSMLLSLRVERMPGAIAEVPPGVALRMEVIRRGVELPLRAIGGCISGGDVNRTVDGRPVIASYRRAGGIGCMIKGEGLDSEGGYLILDPQTGGASVLLHVDDGLTMRRARRVTDDAGQMIRFGGADGVFRLDRVANTACAALVASIVEE